MHAAIPPTPIGFGAALLYAAALIVERALAL
jgi:hypothetical protein